MSGQQWGSVVGGIIGAYFGNPQLGATIGGYIGGAIDPTQIQGPRLTDAKTQTATDGAFRAYGDGTFPTTGNIIWVDPTVKEHETTDDGKGSGQEVTTYTYTISSAIAVCKGPITGYKMVKRNKKVVFDARTDEELTELGYSSQQIAETRAAQAKFLQKCTFYYGVAEQTPDPTMVAVKGVGNVPGYSGTAYIVMTDDDTIEGEVAQFEFVVANCGERTEDYGNWKLLVTGTALESEGPVFASADATAAPEFEGIAQSTGADLANCIPAQYNGVWCAVVDNQCRYSQSGELDSWLSSTIPFPEGYNAITLAGGPAGWVTSGHNGSVPVGIAKAPIVPEEFTEYSPDILQDGSPGSPSTMTGVVASAYADAYYFDVLGGTAGNMVTTPGLEDPVEQVWRVTDNDVLRPFHDLALFQGRLYAASKKGFSTGRQQLVYSEDGGTSWEDPVIDIEGTTTPEYQPFQLATGNNLNDEDVLIVLCWGGEYVYTSKDNFAEPHATGIATSRGTDMESAFKGKMVAFAAGRFYIVSGTSADPAKSNKCVVTTDGLTFSDPISLPVQAVRGIAAGEMGDGVGRRALPDAPGYYVDIATGQVYGPPGTQISVCKPTLGEIVSRQCAKRISTSVIDVGDLTDEVVGFRVASPSSPQKNITATMPGYMFDSSEFDGILHFPKRGGEDSFALTFDDLCERDDGDPIQWERTQEPELLRKITVGYMDPDTTYTATTQQWERRSGTVAAEGEGTLEFPIVGTKDWAAQAAHKNGKVAWGEADKGTLHTSIAEAALVTAAVGTITDENGTIHRIRIEKIDDEGLKRMIEFRRTRADLYQSTVTGASKPLPLFPGSNIRGPADGLLMNLPVLVDVNDVPGIYWAAAGFMSGWIGATLQFLRAGQWVDAGTVTGPAGVGTLLSPLPAHAGDIDTVNTLRLRMNESLESVSWINLLQERNAMAILYPDGTGEIIQPQTVVEVAPLEFECTTLLRGRLATTPGDHDTGARVVFLDSRVQYAILQPTDLGTTLSYRFVSLGTDPDAAEVETIELDTMQSQTEWPVADLAVEQDGDDYTLTWLARDRLGTDVFPLRSTNWRGYEVSWSYGDQTHAEIVLTETVTFNIPSASDITFSVAQLNLYTGAGPAETVTIP